MDKELLAAIHGASYKLEYMTNDRIDAMAGSHGTLNLATLALMDICTEEVIKGNNISLTFKNSKKIDLDHVIDKMLLCTDQFGVDKANGAGLCAIVLYFAGTDTRAGVPAGNRKLGALCRIAAGVSRGGVSNLPTPKLGNKISGFAAVSAIYEELSKSNLTQVNGKNIPFGVIGTLYMHSVLGEDIVIPEVIERGTIAAVNAMDNCMNGVGMMMCHGMASKISNAILSAAAMLEIVHPDANCLYKGSYIPSSHVVGKIAVKELGLPETLHTILLDKTFDTGTIVGDLGLILKDSGGVSVIFMMAMMDMFSMFKEWLVWTGGPTITPISSLGGEAYLAMQLLIENEGDTDSAVQIIKECRNDWFDPEISKIALNIISNKVLETHYGLVSSVLALATEPAKVWALQKRAIKSIEMFKQGKQIEEIVYCFEVNRKETVEKSASLYCSKYFNRKIQIKVLRIEPLGRIAKKGDGIGKYWALDPDLDIKVTIDSKEYLLERFCEICIPKVALNQYQDKDYRTAVESASLFAQDLSYSGVLLLNVSVPVCVGVAYNIGSIRDLSHRATEAAYITGGIPGTRLKCTKAAKITQFLINEY